MQMLAQVLGPRVQHETEGGLPVGNAHPACIGGELTPASRPRWHTACR